MRDRSALIPSRYRALTASNNSNHVAMLIRLATCCPPRTCTRPVTNHLRQRLTPVTISVRQCGMVASSRVTKAVAARRLRITRQ